jgi:hypothetical protein
VIRNIIIFNKRNVVENGIKHHNPNPKPLKAIKEL